MTEENKIMSGHTDGRCMRMCEDRGSLSNDAVCHPFLQVSPYSSRSPNL